MSINKRKSAVLIIIIIIVILALAVYINLDNIKEILKPQDIKNVEQIKAELGNKIKSGSLATDYSVDKVISDIFKFRLNTINIPVVVDVNLNTPDIMTINIESKEKAFKLIRKLKRLGINIILEPFPYINHGEKSETNWEPVNINNWFINWKTSILGVLIDEIAVPYKVYALNIASNLSKVEYAEGYWLDTIDYVKSKYKGLVTYRTNWWSTAAWDSGENSTYIKYQKKLNNKLFAKLDFISVASYFELSKNQVNNVSNLISKIYSTDPHNRKQNVYQELKNFYLKTGKQVFFGELGFPKRNGAALQPWNPSPTSIINSLEQANCFEAYRKVFENENWILGMSVFFIGDYNENREYYPGNESMEVIKNWYKKGY